ncbi:MAG: hypothetical protein KatS3mg111_1587 [Pirellulaceae bacterium]|nr:MAG: hypothetical protein KatS3mg111_1587 [Pirellulaceae bacterium]
MKSANGAVVVAIGITLWLSAWDGIGAAEPVLFDVPAILSADPVDQPGAVVPRRGGKLLRVRVPISTVLDSQFQGRVFEYHIELVSPHRSMQVLDLWPRNELVRTIEGNVAVETSRQSDHAVGVNLLSASKPPVPGGVNASVGEKQTISQRYEQKPPLHLLTASGTTNRGCGAFFKFRAGPIGLADGMRDVALLVEVPRQWRADILEVRMHATGSRSRSGTESQPLGASHSWLAIYQRGDDEAAQAAEHFVESERSLRRIAECAQQLHQRTLPTVFHRLGAALDIVEPRLPEDFLVQALFGPHTQYLEGGAHRLPVDLRVAILEFWDARRAMIDLAFTGQVSTANLGLMTKSSPRAVF